MHSLYLYKDLPRDHLGRKGKESKEFSFLFFCIYSIIHIVLKWFYGKPSRQAHGTHILHSLSRDQWSESECGHRALWTFEKRIPACLHPHQMVNKDHWICCQPHRLSIDLRFSVILHFSRLLISNAETRLFNNSIVPGFARRYLIYATSAPHGRQSPREDLPRCCWLFRES